MTRPAGATIPVLRLGAFAFMAVLLAACARPDATGTPAAGASHDPAPAGFPLIGAWTTTITRDDLRAGGVTAEGLLGENSGIFTWAFEADGTWRQVQIGLDGSPLLNPVFSGYFFVDGDVLVAVTEFPEQFADDGLRFEFEVDGDAATFDLLNPPDPMLPVIIEAHPWTRGTP